MKKGEIIIYRSRVCIVDQVKWSTAEVRCSYNNGEHFPYTIDLRRDCPMGLLYIKYHILGAICDVWDDCDILNLALFLAVSCAVMVVLITIASLISTLIGLL